jgi:hypothetical protein
MSTPDPSVLFAACAAGDAAAVCAALALDPAAAHSRDPSTGDTPLHVAARSCELGAVEVSR